MNPNAGYSAGYNYANLREPIMPTDNNLEQDARSARSKNNQNTQLHGGRIRNAFHGSNQAPLPDLLGPRNFTNAPNPLRTPSQEQAIAQNQFSYMRDGGLAQINPCTVQPSQLNPHSFSSPNDQTEDASLFPFPDDIEDLGLFPDFQPQNTHRALDTSQNEPRDQTNEHVSNNQPNLLGPASATSPLPTQKRRKRGDFSNEEVYHGEGTNNPSFSEDFPRPYDNDIVLLCCAWCVVNPNKKPEPSDYALMSSICNVSGDDVKYVFESIQSRDMRPGQNSPGPIPSSILNIWHRKNPGKTPSKELFVCMERVYHGQYDSLCRFSTRNAMSPIASRDSAMGKSLGTTVSSMSHAPSHTEESQIWCKSIAKKGSGKRIHRRDWKYDPQRPYLCPDCGQNFPRKGDWKRHMSRNSRTVAWFCPICQSKPWSRNDQLIEHIEKNHLTEGDESSELRGTLSYKNFKNQCIFRDCPTTFNNFKDSMDHIALCLESHAQWVSKDLRCDEDDSISGAIVDPIENPRSERRDDDGPDGSGHKGQRDEFGGNNNSSSGPGSSSPSGPSPFQGSRGSGGVAHTGHTFGVTRKYSSASDEVPIVGRSPSESTFWRILSHFKSILPSKFHFLGRLGSGGRAVVDEVWITGFDRTLALKTYKSSLQNPFQEWRREIEIMAKLKKHPCIVTLVPYYIRPGSSALLIQPVADYDLDKYLERYSATLKEEHNIWLWFSYLASGLKFLHENGVIHHDIKPQNILVKDQKVLFADFGSSCTIDETRLLGNRALHHTKLYAAPELERGDFTTASDVFSLGCVFLEMVTALISLDMRKQLRALQDSLYRQELSYTCWALEWTEQILEKSSEKVSEDKFGPIIEICRQMTQLENEQRPNAASLHKQVNLLLCRQSDYSMRGTHHSDKSWSPKRPNQEAEVQSKRPTKVFKIKPADNMTDITRPPSHPNVSVPDKSPASKASSGWRRSVKKSGRRLKRSGKANNVKGADATSDVAGSEHSSTSVSAARNRTKSLGHYTSQIGDIPSKMLDRFMNDGSALQDSIISGYSRYDEHGGLIPHSPVHQKFAPYMGLKHTSPASIKSKPKARSLPAPIDYAVETKTSSSNNNNFRSSSHVSPKSSRTYQTKDIGSQFLTEFVKKVPSARSYYEFGA